MIMQLGHNYVFDDVYLHMRPVVRMSRKHMVLLYKVGTVDGCGYNVANKNTLYYDACNKGCATLFKAY